jgi:putative spermidine/putrescine transport system substrate-binding protein
MTSKLSRRQFMKAGIGTTATLAVSSVAARGRAAPGELTIVGWGGDHESSLKKAVYDPFTAATGVRVKSISSMAQLAGLKAQVQANNPEWDIIQPASLWVARGAKEGLFEKIDYSIVDAKDLYKTSVHPYATAFEVFAVDIAFNTAKFPGGAHPRSWAELWDVKRFPGRRTAPGWTPRDNLEAAVMAGGVPTNKVYPIDIKLAFAKLEELKPNTVWWNTGAQFAQMFADGEVDLGYGWGARITVIARGGKKPLAVEFNQAILDQTFYAISRVSRNKEAAMKFVAFAVQVKPQTERPKLYPQGPTNKKAWEALDAATRADLVNPEMRNVVIRDHEWWVDREEGLIAQWKQFLGK